MAAQQNVPDDLIYRTSVSSTLFGSLFNYHAYVRPPRTPETAGRCSSSDGSRTIWPRGWRRSWCMSTRRHCRSSTPPASFQRCRLPWRWAVKLSPAAYACMFFLSKTLIRAHEQQAHLAVAMCGAPQTRQDMWLAGQAGSSSTGGRARCAEAAPPRRARSLSCCGDF